jgi:hypothetical protein
MSVDMAVRRTSASRIVTAPPEQIFDVLTDPSKHPLVDGSGTVHSTGKSERLKLGSKFDMSMTFSLMPYRIAGYPKRHLGSTERTLDNLADLYAQ